MIGVGGVQINEGCEYEIIPPDWAQAFNGVAPYVAEARAYLRGEPPDVDAALRALDTAYENVVEASRSVVVAHLPRGTVPG